MTPGALSDILIDLVPELAERSLYIVFATSVTKALASARLYEGLTSGLLDATLRPYIRCWRGRGPAILLSDHLLADQAEGLRRAGFDAIEADAHTFISVALHELAHVLDLGEPYYLAEPAGGSRLDVDALAVFLSLPDGSLVHRGVPAWFGHGLTWIRIVCHLSYRLYRRLGLTVSPAAIAGNRYGLSHLSEYAERLDGETDRLIDATFATIAATPPPREFLDLWASDTAPRATSLTTEQKAMKTLDNVRLAVVSREADLQAEFETLAESVARGDDVDEAEALGILDRAGKTHDDLTEAVRRLERRRQLRAQLDAGARAQADLAQIRGRLAVAASDLEIARQTYARRTVELHALEADALAILQRAEQARAELLSTAPTTAKTGAASAQERHRQAHAQRVEAAKVVDVARFRVREAEALHARTGEYATELAGAKSRLARAEARLADLDREARRLEAERVEAREQLLRA